MNKIALTMLLLTTTSFSAWCESLVKKVPVPHANDETLDLTDTEILSQETFQDLFAARAQEQIPLLIARVATVVNRNIVTTYFEASGLYRFLFSEDKPNRYTIAAKLFLNPVNNQGILPPIHFFMLENASDDKLTYLGSEFELQLYPTAQGQAFRAQFFSNFPGLKPIQREALRQILTNYEGNENLAANLARAFVEMGTSYRNNKEYKLAEYFYRSAYHNDAASMTTRVLAAAQLAYLYVSNFVEASSFLVPANLANFALTNSADALKLTARILLGLSLAMSNEPAVLAQARNHLDFATKELLDSNMKPYALLKLGQMLKLGLGGPVDLSGARSLFERAALQTSSFRIQVLAKLELAEMLLAGQGGDADVDKAHELLASVALQDRIPDAKARANFNLAKMSYLDVRFLDWARARNLFEIAALQNDDLQVKAMAQGLTATMYQLGQGGPADLEKAREMFEGAASQQIDKDVQAQAAYRLATMHYRRQIKNVDLRKAREFLKIAATQTLSAEARDGAESMLGQIYYYGDGVPVDYERARHYFENILGRQTSEVHRFEARLYMGIMHRLGLGGPADFPKAFHFLESVTNQDSFPALKALAQLQLATMFRFGEGGLTVNLERARALYRAASEQQFDKRVREEASRLLLELEASIMDTAQGKKRSHEDELG